MISRPRPFILIYCIRIPIPALALQRLSVLRQIESSAAIKGELFRSDVEDSKPSQLIASLSSDATVSFDMNLLALDLEAFESLVGRQRLGHEEY